MNPKGTRRSAFVVGVAAVIVIALAISAWKHFESSHAHHHPAELSLDGGRRWQTDPPLRAGLTQIRDAAVPVAAAFARRQLTREQAGAFSDSVGSSFAMMAQTCKLPPKADATLHALIAELMRGAALLASDPTSQEGIDLVTKTLRQYGEYFDHPGWEPLTGS